MDADTHHPTNHLPPHLNRSTDRCMALMLLITMLPVFALIAVAIKLDSQGPIIEVYDGKKPNGKVFKLYKFRTQLWHLPARTKSMRYHMGLTHVGRFLRETGLEELPMLVNVVKGDLSFNGHPPRFFR